MEAGSYICSWWFVSDSRTVQFSIGLIFYRAGIVGFVKIGEAYAANDRK